MTLPTLGFIFPGQGSQKIGMLAEAAKQYPELLETFDHASEQLGYDLWDLSQHGTAEEIGKTEITQPLLLAASVSIWRLWKSLNGAMPSVMAGHSLGEWSALVCADVVGFEDALTLVQKRGQYMQESVPAGQGAMSAIVGLDDDNVIAACLEAAQGEIVTAVNFNAPGQVVIAGAAEAVARANVICKEAGAKRALPLPVSGPFHTSMIQPAADRLSVDIANVEFSAPSIPVIHNVTLGTENDPEQIKQLMIKQITAPVPWVKTVQGFAPMGVTSVVECGPGKVLAGLIRRIDKELVCHNSETPNAIASALDASAH